MAVVVNGNSRHVFVAPITHATPNSVGNSMRIPQATKERLGLDETESWIILDELNEFAWPGPDVRPVPGKKLSTCSYGLISASTYLALREKLLKLIEAGALRNSKRTD